MSVCNPSKYEDDDDIAVYSKAFYMQYAQGDQVFAEFLKAQDEDKAERNRKRLTFSIAGKVHTWDSVDLPEDMWREVVYRDWPMNKKIKPNPVDVVLAPEDEDDEFEQVGPQGQGRHEQQEQQGQQEQQEQQPVVPEQTEEERIADVVAAAFLAGEESSKEQVEKEREADQRAEMRRKCCQSAQARRWGYNNWSEVETVGSKRRMRTPDGTGVPPLLELAELALQKAFEMRGQYLQLPEEMRRMGYMITPVAMNGELCRIIRSRPAIE